jgi:hypothetical protein
MGTWLQRVYIHKHCGELHIGIAPFCYESSSFISVFALRNYSMMSRRRADESDCGAEVDENTPLLGGKDAVVGVTSKSSCAKGDEESACGVELLGDKRSPVDVESGVAGVISILLLGMLVCFSIRITSSVFLSRNSSF